MPMKDAISKVAALHGVPEEEVRADMQEAIRAAGIDLAPEQFIEMMAALVQQENPAN